MTSRFICPTSALVSALVIAEAASRAPAPARLWALAAPAVVLAVAYGWLLFRGPFEKELGDRRTS